MIAEAGLQTLARNVPGRSSRKRHWRRWILAGLGVLCRTRSPGCWSVHQAPADPLSAGAAHGGRQGAGRPPGGHVGRRGRLGGGFPRPGDRPGNQQRDRRPDARRHRHHRRHRPERHRGGVPHRPDRHQVGGKTQPQFATSLGTRQHPVATFTLTQPVTLGSAFASGATITATATGQLTMRGIAHLVTVTISGQIGRAHV